MASPAMLLPLAAFAAVAHAHEHHGDNIPPGEAVSKEPIVRTETFSNFTTLNTNNI